MKTSSIAAGPTLGYRRTWIQTLCLIVLIGLGILLFRTLWTPSVQIPVFEVRTETKKLAGYLVPSVHRGLQRRPEPAPFLIRIIQDAPAVAFEIDESNAKDVKAARELLVSESSGARERYLIESKGAREVARNAFVQHGFNPEQARSLAEQHPLLLISTLESVCYADVIVNSFSIDELLRRIAQKSGRETLSIESPESALRGIFTLTPAYWSQRIIDAVGFSERASCKKDTRKLYDGVAEAYEQRDFGRIVTLGRTLEETISGNTVFVDAILDLDARNAHLTEKIQQQLQMRPGMVFIVGAAHFAASGGLPDRLRAMGYQVNLIPARS